MPTPLEKLIKNVWDTVPPEIRYRIAIQNDSDNWREYSEKLLKDEKTSKMKENNSSIHPGINNFDLFLGGKKLKG